MNDCGEPSNLVTSNLPVLDLNRVEDSSRTETLMSGQAQSFNFDDDSSSSEIDDLEFRNPQNTDSAFNSSDSDVSSKSEEIDEGRGRSNLFKKLASWVVSDNIPRRSSDKLLKILNKENIQGIPYKITFSNTKYTN